MRTITYTVYTESGGVGKTFLGANLAKAHADDGLDVLAIDLDVQDGSLSYLLDAVADRRDGSADNLVRHMVGRPKGAFENLIVESAEGIDVIPNHAMLERLSDLLGEAADAAGPEFNPYAQLFRVLRENDVPGDYDVIVCDPPGMAGPHLFNAIYATRSLVVPMELSGKGEQSVEGLNDLVDGLEAALGIDVGVLAVVPNGVKHTKDIDAYLDKIGAEGYDTPIVIGDREALIEACWDEQCSAFTMVHEHRARKREYEMDTLDQIEALAQHITEQVRGVEA